MQLNYHCYCKEFWAELTKPEKCQPLSVFIYHQVVSWRTLAHKMIPVINIVCAQTKEKLPAKEQPLSYKDF